MGNMRNYHTIMVIQIFFIIEGDNKQLLVCWQILEFNLSLEFE